jgi:2-methylcitrate dehydratase PrpD
MQTRMLAEFAADLQYGDLPDDVRVSARDCIQDTIGVMIFGAELPWSRIVLDYVRRNGGGGRCHVLGASGFTTTAPFAALANGAATHAFDPVPAFIPAESFRRRWRLAKIWKHPGVT